MKNLLNKMFSGSSDVSAMRVMAMLSLLVGATLAFMGLYMGKDLNALATLCAIFVGSGFAGKATQKFAETKLNSSKSPKADDPDA